MNSIPIIYYHSVANHKIARPWSFLSCPIEIFTSQMKWLKKKGYYTCDWAELRSHMMGDTKLPDRSIHIHFDDGFLDNWTVVYPLMKELQLKFTILVTPEFIERSNIKRQFVEDTTLDNEKEWWGYLSEGEIREMSDSGLVDFQAHGYTHTWYPSSDKVIDIYDGSQVLPHLQWNEDINEKPFWLLSTKKLLKHGTPIFENEKSLSNKSRFIPNKETIKKLSLSYNPELDRVDNVSAFNSLLADKNYTSGSYETSEDYTERIKRELLLTREYIAKITGKEVKYIVYPGGGKLDSIDVLAKKYGYDQTSKGKELNSYGCKSDKVLRFTGFHSFKIFSSPLNLILLKLQILRGNGNSLVSFLFAILKKII